MKIKTNAVRAFRLLKIKFFPVIFSLLTLGIYGNANAYNNGDFGYIGRGSWGTLANWFIYNSGSWNSAGAFPTFADNVYLLSGDSVCIEVSGKDCKNLFIESGAQLCADQSVNNNFYINVFGKQVVDNGIIGSATAGLFNGISFNMEGDTVTVSTDSISPVIPGNTPLFTCSRIRKSAVVPNVTTNVFIDMDLYLTFFSNSQTQIYNNVDNSVFNVTINKNRTVNIGYLGNIGIDGIAGASGGNRGGTITVKGRLNVSGTVYMRSTNSTKPCALIIDSTGVVNTQKIDTQNSSTAAGGHTTTIRAGGRLELTGIGNGWSATLAFFGGTFNTYNFLYNSNVVYMANGAQTVATTVTYSNLIMTSLPPGSRTISANLAVTKNFILQNNAQFSPTTKTIAIGGNYFSPNHTNLSAGTSLFVFNGFDGTQQTITTGDYEVFNNMQVNNLLGVKINVPVNIKNNLDLPNGPLDLNGNPLIVYTASSASITRTSGYILSENVLNLSKIKWYVGSVTGTYTFPFGNATGSYIPFTFNLNSGNADTVIVSTYAASATNTPWPTQPVAVTNLISSIGLMPDNRNATVKRFWQVDPLGTPTANITLSYSAAELPVMGGPYKAQNWGQAIGFWIGPYPSQSNIGNTVTISNATSFGALAIASVASPLPIALLSFTAEPDHDDVLTKWITASETNNDYFTVERMNEGGQIEKLAQVDGAGNSNVIHNYSFIDTHPLKGLSYYRISQTDYDGLTKFFDWIAVNITTKEQDYVIYPNPVIENEIRILNSDENETSFTFLIVDLNGREIEKGTANIFNPIIVENMAKGIYTLIFSFDDEKQTSLRFIKD